MVVLACFLFALIANVRIRAQEYGFDVWTTANGLPQNTVTGVVQTPDGYLWLSTFDGMARFDGVRFTIFDKGNSRGIINNRFSSLFADPQGAVWAPTENGVVTVYRGGTFTSYQTASSGAIVIVPGAGGEAVIETTDGLYRFEDGALVPTGDQKEMRARQFYYGRSGAKWTFEQNGVTRQKDGQTTVYPLTLPPESLTSTVSLKPYEERQGALWISLSGKMCRLADGNTRVFTKNEIPPLSQLTSQVIFDDGDGGVWIVFEVFDLSRNLSAALVRFKDGQFTSYDLGKAVGTTSGLTDREGNFWLATVTGLRRLRQQLITSLSMEDGLLDNEVYPLLQTRGGDIFIGTVRGVNRSKDGSLTELRVRDPDDATFYMRGLWQDDEDRLWLGYQGNGGFGRYEGSSRVKRIGRDDLPNGATDFASDRGGNVWIATSEGLYKYKDDTQIAHYTARDGLPNDTIITVHVDRSGDLWLGTFDGLARFSGGSFTNYNLEPDSPKGFVRAIYEDPEGVLWFGTYGDGLVRYKDGRFFNFRVEHGLFNNGVFAILDDGLGSFWMSSNRGIHRASTQELNDLADGLIPKLNSVSYDENDGMPNAECNGGRMPAAIKAKDGKLWFPTMGGVAIVDPAAEKPNPKAPPVLVENIAIDRKPVSGETLRSAIDNAQSAVELQPGQSNIAIEYTALSLTRSDQIKFRYRLEGLEENWVEAGTKRSVDYSYLPAGSYTFRLIAANANGVWNNEGSAIRIVVHPFFYQTWWFIVLLALAAIFVVWWFYHTRVSRLRAVAEAKTLFSQQLIQSQEAERKRIASELHDGLGQSLVVIKNRALLGLNKRGDQERVAKELGSISESASQAIDEVREITNNLRPQLLDRLGLTRAIQAMLKKTAGVIEIDHEIDDIDQLFSENEEISIYRIVQESVGNIIKHSNASDASVRIRHGDGRVVIEIEDNGQGFAVDAPDAKRTGLGLVGLKERTQLLGGEISIESAPGKGTRIRVEVRVKGP